VEMAPDGKPIRISTVPEHKELACLNALDCTSCLEESNCGWCQGKKCVPGGPSGPFSGSCSTWSFDYCPNQSECPYTTCSSCLDDADCGWCQSSHHCFLGNATQPLDGNCDSSSYYYTSCPGSTSESVDYYITFPANTFGWMSVAWRANTFVTMEHLLYPTQLCFSTRLHPDLLSHRLNWVFMAFGLPLQRITKCTSI